MRKPLLSFDISARVNIRFMSTDGADVVLKVVRVKALSEP